MRLHQHKGANNWEEIVDGGSLSFVTIEPGRLLLEIVGKDASGKRAAFRVGMDGEEAARLAHRLALFNK